jgi:hypothetical protein
VGLTGAVVAVAIVRAEVSDTIVVEDGKSTKSSVIRAENHDTNNLGKGAEYNSLSAQLSVWFGNATGRYLPDYMFEDENPSPGTEIRVRPLFEEFSALYGRGPAEYDATLINGLRMVVRFVPYQATYKAFVFLQPDGDIAAAGFTFDDCPIGGLDRVINGVSKHVQCDWPFSVVIFHKTPAMDSVVESAVKNYFASLPLPIEKSMAREMTSDGKIRIKIYGHQI